MRVYIESPYSHEDPEIHQKQLEYLTLCILDCINRGEAPFAAHAFYVRYLDDSDKRLRFEGMKMGREWGGAADKVVVYTDYGISSGMQWGIDQAENDGQEVEYREIKEKL